MEAVKQEYFEADLNEEAKKWREKDQNELIIDFDEAVKEERAKSIKVKFQGKTYDLPKRAPAWLPLFVNRYGEGRNNVLSDKHNLEMIEGLLGKEFAAKIVDEQNNFVSFEVVNDHILKPVFKQWGFGDAKDVKKPTTPGS